MAQTLDPEQFAKTFLGLLHTAGEKQLADDFVSNDLPARPFVPLAKMPQDKLHSSPSSDSVEASRPSVAVTLKSIKGVKFTHTITVVGPAKYSIYTLKEQLLADMKDELKGYQPANVRILVKGKVQPDFKAISDLTEDQESISLTVMLSTPTLPVAADEEPETEDISKVELTAEDWTAIGALLESRLGQSQASEALKRLQSGWSVQN